MKNPVLRVDWPPHITSPGRWRRARCVCGARYRAFKTPGCPADLRKRFLWAKRQLTALDGDQSWYWSRRTLLWALHYLKATAFLAVHVHCGEVAEAGSRRNFVQMVENWHLRRCEKRAA